MRYLFVILMLFIGAQAVCASAYNEGAGMGQFYFPEESVEHEGTWLIWPHEHTYGKDYQKEVEPIWIAMTKALAGGEKVHIIAYDKDAQRRIKSILESNGVDMKQVDFTIAKSDDVWVRDTGPIFVYDEKGSLVIADFIFDGWGGKTDYDYDNDIPLAVAEKIDIPLVDIPFVLEGGSIEIDGKGTLMATRSSTVSKSRNPDMTVKEAEEYMKRYLGVERFIWLEGVEGEDITDAHIDGMARFIDSGRILTVSEEDFLQLYLDIDPADYEVLKNAKNIDGKKYTLLTVPLTAKNVKGLDYKGSYLNYYIGNDVLLMPIYNDKNDKKAIDIIAKLYPNKKIVPIDVSKLYKYGGMLHCVTQQQPMPGNF